MDVESYKHAILNAGYLVRYYPRPGQRLQRMQAFHRMGLTARAAFESASTPEEFATLLLAIADGVRPDGDAPPF